ncbi:zinc finger HIT domain-containing protein 2 [Sergentomyia squamirostris]
MSSVDQCQLCLKQAAKYSCPKCNILYCSVPCYKSQAHLQCSETFYKQCIAEELASSASSSGRQDSSTRKMYEILERVKGFQDDPNGLESYDDVIEEIDNPASDEDEEGDGLDSDDDNLEVDLASRLDGVDLNDPEAVWSKLTASEQKDFESLVHGGDVTNILPVYKPWWEEESPRKLVQEANSSSQEKLNYPAIKENIKDFSVISSKSPAPCVRHNLTNILTSYCFTVRYFNGEYLNNSQEFCNCLVGICGNIKSNCNYDSDTMAVESVALEARNEGILLDNEDIRAMKEDVKRIYAGLDGGKNVFVLAALSDLHSVLSLARKSKTQEKSSAGMFSKRFVDPDGREFKVIEKSRIPVYLKKIEFFLSYSKDIPL